MITIIQNAVKCRHCGDIIESRHRHDFVAHYCSVSPRTATRLESDGPDVKIVECPGEVTYNFAVDGGNAYLRRIGIMSDFEDVSKYWPGFNGSHLSHPPIPIEAVSTGSTGCPGCDSFLNE